MKRFLLFLSTVALMFSTGCSKNVGLSSNYRAIENLKLIHTIGFDIHKDGLQLSVSGGESENQGITRLSASGTNISDALSTVQKFSGKEELYYAHTRYILVGEEYAKNGLGDIMQYLESSNQLRSDLPLFILKDGNAKDLIMHAGGKENSTFEILEAAVRDCTQRGDSYPFTCGEIAGFIAEYGSALACALKIVPTKEINPQAEDDELTPIVSGFGIIKDGKLVDYLSEDASKGINLLINELGTGEVTVTLNNQPVSLRIRSVDTTLRPVFGQQGTMTKLTVEMDIKATLEEHPQGLAVDFEKMSSSFSKIVTQWITEILQTMRTTQTDFLGLGSQIAISYPNQFENNPLSWNTQLKTLLMDTDITCKVTAGENDIGR